MKKRIQEPNYQMLFSSAVTALQQTYNEYKKALIKDIDFTFVGKDGMYVTLAGAEERAEKISELGKEIVRLKYKVEEYRQETERQKGVKKDG